MFLISHRGNLNGPNPVLENNPDYIINTLNLGFDVEIDVWFNNGDFYLGHDTPQYKINYNFLTNDRLWCHAKNIESLVEMKKYSIHYFWHETDTVTLTSKNYIWAFPTITPIENSIIVMPEIHNVEIKKCKGICSDYIKKYS
jgi:hypothetical protein